MFEILSRLPLSNLIYLGGVIVAFFSFGTALASVHIWSNLPVSRPARPEPAVRPSETPVQLAMAA